jgi:quercetin dioxygenase-like cupin family protein
VLVVAEHGSVERRVSEWTTHMLFPDLERLTFVPNDRVKGLNWAMTHFPAGNKNVLHSNGNSQQWIFVIKGPIALILPNARAELETGDCLWLRPQSEHGWEVPDDDGATLMIMSVPVQ